ncbi:unnamed protein product [Polarella glacialis]|uniref:Ion transport domain-containing protein n=1 Tax=Polarella glacialis TaxID=89957 RepID=A0A813EXK2_POLGL|nr:unnamed protein product [Polarella glacialis]
MKSFGDNKSGSSWKALRSLRIVRLFRGLRIARILRFVHSLQKLLHCIAATMKSLMWTILLLCIIFYGCGVALAQATADYCREVAVQESGNVNAIPRCNMEALDRYWSSVPRSMLTLLKSTSAGISWELVLEPLG